MAADVMGKSLIDESQETEAVSNEWLPKNNEWCIATVAAVYDCRRSCNLLHYRRSQTADTVEPTMQQSLRIGISPLIHASRG
jgi:predicted RNA-binding protein with PUA-like domain